MKAALVYDGAPIFQGAADEQIEWTVCLVLDLMTTDIKGAKPFYGDVAGWTTSKWSGGDYEMWTAGKDMIGGLMPLPSEEKKAGPHWLSYIGTDDVAATVKKAQELGGKVLVAPKPIPDVGTFAVLEDPQGASFAVYKSNTPNDAPPTQ